MKLLLDNNLSPRLLERLAGAYPDMVHVADAGLNNASDQDVWNFAQAQGCVIVTKDSDFVDLQVIRGFPPKVVVIHLGNCTTAQVEDLLRRHQPDLLAFSQDPNAGLLLLG
jgi:predicted nuclease of predicted toxin-antitoxin system